MDKSIKILTVCNKGVSRSVGTRVCLYRRGYKNVIAIGCTTTSFETLIMLCDWADKILLAKPYHALNLPVDVKTVKKIDKKFTIGEDLWGDPLSKKLHGIANKQLDLIGLK